MEEVHLKITNPDGSINTTYFVKTELGEEARKKRERVKLKVKDTASKLKGGNIQLRDIGIAEEIYQLKTIDSRKVTQEWVVAQRFGFDEPNVVPQSVDVAYQNG